MTTPRNLLLIPVENQVRELDPKLLLACVAARQGFSSVIGSRREMELSIDSFPQAIYASKSMTIRSLLFFHIARRFNHKIIAWDEEALVHLPSETYFSRRLNPSAMKFVSNLFAWGQDNAELWRQYPQLPKDIPIHVVNNPRGDMLRPEIYRFYQKEAEEIRNNHGNFILVNTNFNHVNAFGPDMNLFKPVKKPGGKPKFGRAARGMTRNYAKGLSDHKQAVFGHFRQLIPALERAFPSYTIVVRPHPTENHEVYHRIAAQCQHVRVTNEGNIVPWLMATRALIHNGCTTGVEAYLMGVPAISYRVAVNDDYDHGFYRLPNMLSYECFDFDELRTTLEKILAGELGVADGVERRNLVNQYLAAQDGPLACERIVNVLKKFSETPDRLLKYPAVNKLERWILSKALSLARHTKSRLPGSHNLPEFQRHRYPKILIDDVRTRIARFQQLLGDSRDLRIRQISDVIFQIDA